ncbi:hypothetical protein SAMN05518801_106120 [Novosphingobium sp. CF614]|uniref:hypothetical protein n=1 Tax=Novosphingobium sp. CF614 TaxID=1884364 RepID=UPI0008E74AF3|nr:hypothetical protein [Novosphingobium sp. CF614]SFG04886.1 hypothetical protein SAMN05518801_106120 [Novosphingobium sp. CF614]
MSASKVRGQPLAALLAVLAGWIGGRAASWEAPMPADEAFAARTAVQAELFRSAAPATGFVVDGRLGPQSLPGALPSGFAPGLVPVMASVMAPLLADRFYAGAEPFRMVLPASPRPAAAWDPAGSAWGPSARMFVPSNLHSSEPLPRFLAPEVASSGVRIATPAVAPATLARARRWSADSWALLRRDDGGTLSAGVLPATYGASQAGAVLRYRIDPSSRYRPTAYMRTTSTLGQVRETAAALGLAARPVPSVPIVAALEGRLTDQASARRFQPAAFVHTELPPLALSARLRAEAYFQGGYVGGKFATPFADGQLRVDRALPRLGPVEARLGGGIWGGAQKGAARLDAGPSATVALPLGRKTFGRVAFDWRFRVAGDAQPGSGPAVTVSAGF